MNPIKLTPKTLHSAETNLLNVYHYNTDLHRFSIRVYRGSPDGQDTKNKVSLYLSFNGTTALFAILPTSKLKWRATTRTQAKLAAKLATQYPTVTLLNDTALTMDLLADAYNTLYGELNTYFNYQMQQVHRNLSRMQEHGLQSIQGGKFSDWTLPEDVAIATAQCVIEYYGPVYLAKYNGCTRALARVLQFRLGRDVTAYNRSVIWSMATWAAKQGLDA